MVQLTDNIQVQVSAVSPGGEAGVLGHACQEARQLVQLLAGEARTLPCRPGWQYYSFTTVLLHTCKQSKQG